MIKKIKWKNHDILGNLELDFTREDGTSYNTIVFAGENGVGKTTILETLSSFLNFGSFEPFESITYEINGTDYLIEQDQKLNAKYGQYSRKKLEDNNSEQIRYNSSFDKEKIDEDILDLRHYGCAYSKARSGFKTGVVNSTTNEQLDSEKHLDDDKEDFTAFKHLIIDITSQDNASWAELSKNGSKITYEDFEKTSKMNRFISTFNSFFDTMKYNKVDEEDPKEKKILFSKYDKDIDVDNLSTGEKQIVYRGAYLLKNSKNITDGFVLIDEPELSMHPKWQQNILNYYRRLFDNEGAQQNVQMFFATHSEYVIKSALKDQQNILIIVLKNQNGKILARKVNIPSALSVITAAETNYIAFELPTIDYHIELYSHLQDAIGGKTIKACDNYIVNQSEYERSKHEKEYTYGKVNYKSLPTFIRNCIDHPESGYSYTQQELECSIELLIELCKKL